MELAKDYLTEVWAGTGKLQGVMSCTEKTRDMQRKKSPDTKTKQNRYHKENVRATLREEGTQSGEEARGHIAGSYSSLFLHFLPIGGSHQKSRGLKSLQM